MADSDNLYDDVLVNGNLTKRPSNFSDNISKESKSDVDSDESLLDISEAQFEEDKLLLAVSNQLIHAKTVVLPNPSTSAVGSSPARLSHIEKEYNQLAIVSQQSLLTGVDDVTAVPALEDPQTTQDQAYLSDILASAGHLSPRQTRFNPFDFPSPPTTRQGQAITANQGGDAGSSQVRPRDSDQFDQLNFGDPTFISSYFKASSAGSRDLKHIFPGEPSKSNLSPAADRFAWDSNNRITSLSSLHVSHHRPHTHAAAVTTGHPSFGPVGLDSKVLSLPAGSSGTTRKHDALLPPRGPVATGVVSSAPAPDVAAMAASTAERRNTGSPGLILQDYTATAARDQFRTPSLITKSELVRGHAPERIIASGAMSANKQTPPGNSEQTHDVRTNPSLVGIGGVSNSKLHWRYGSEAAVRERRHFEDEDDEDEGGQQEASPLLDPACNSRTGSTGVNGWRATPERGAWASQATDVTAVKFPPGRAGDQKPNALHTLVETDSGASGGMTVLQGERDYLKRGARGVTPHNGATDSTADALGKQQSLLWQRNSYGEFCPVSGSDHGEHNLPAVTYRHCHKKRLASLTDKLALRQLVSVVVLCILFMTGEAVGGALANRLALFTDVLHLGGDLVSFLIRLLAMWLANKPATKKMSFGYHRAEVIGALLSVFLIWLVSGVLCYIAIERIIEGHYMNVKPDEMLITASLGVLFNFVMAFVLHSEVCCGKAHSHNKFGHGHSHGGHGHSHGGHGHSHGGHGHSRGGYGPVHKDLLDVACQEGQHEITADESEGFNYQRLHSQEPEFESSGQQMRDVNSQQSTSESENGLTDEEALHKHKNINVRAAFIHVVGDIIQSLGVLVAALIIKFTDDDKFRLADPICTFLFSIIVLITTITVLRDALLVIMEGVPRDLSFESLKRELLTLEGVVAVHSLHIWALTMDRNALSVHLAIENPYLHNQVLTLATKLIQDRHHYIHSTIQVELYNEVAMRDCKDCLELN
ncbi:unnamed protein product [Lymnaea stagnalis]|uniref:Uncharacterized protein n=1 Tax=Lymnaea stagnalis TaxID=6523 RepID=A0AAV2IPJ5_LYMST